MGVSLLVFEDVPWAMVVRLSAEHVADEFNVDASTVRSSVAKRNNALPPPLPRLPVRRPKPKVRHGLGRRRLECVGVTCDEPVPVSETGLDPVPLPATSFACEVDAAALSSVLLLGVSSSCSSLASSLLSASWCAATERLWLSIVLR